MNMGEFGQQQTEAAVLSAQTMVRAMVSATAADLLAPEIAGPHYGRIVDIRTVVPSPLLKDAAHELGQQIFEFTTPGLVFPRGIPYGAVSPLEKSYLYDEEEARRHVIDRQFDRDTNLSLYATARLGKKAVRYALPLIGRFQKAERLASTPSSTAQDFAMSHVYQQSIRKSSSLRRAQP